jgi:predicted dehydrogenase
MPRAPERRYRGVILGAGGVARRAHLPAFLDDPRVRQRLKIVGMVDSAADLPPVEGIPIVRSIAELPTFGHIDFVDVCTPTASHLDLVLWSLEQGYHVLCEKPVALSAESAARIARVAEQTKRVVMPCHQYRFNPAWQQLNQWLCADRIGAWHLAEVEVYRATADAGLHATGVPWRGLGRESLGGVLLDHGTHLIYQLLDVAGSPLAVSAWTRCLLHRDYDVEDTAHLILEFPERAATVLLTWAGRGRENRMRFTGPRGTIEWIGSELRLEADDGTEHLDVTAQLDKAAYPGWFARLFVEFAAALDDGAAPRALQDIHNVASVLESAYAAARSGRRVVFPDAA